MARSAPQCKGATSPRIRRIAASSSSTRAEQPDMMMKLHALLSRSLLPLAACALLVGCASTPPEEDPVVQKLTELDGRLLRIERVLANQSLLDLSQRIEAANSEVRVLRGQLDELQHSLNQTREQEREMYAAVERRRAAVVGGGVGGASLASFGSGSGLRIPQGDDRANYQAAFHLLKDGKYPDAVRAFSQ